VIIYPSLGGSFQGVHPIQEHMRTTFITSTFIVKFFQEIIGVIFIQVTRETNCNLGCNGNF
jgi:hypothetical protein